MRYTSPQLNEKPYWVPIVCKNRDYLIGYLNGVGMRDFTYTDMLKSINVNLDVDDLDLFLDSSRFNDLMQNGKRERDLSKKEKQELFTVLFKAKMELLNRTHEENHIEYDDILSIECECGLGFYAWMDYEDIPHKNFECTECNRMLINYTDVNDYEYEFDGGKDEDQQES